MIAAFAVARASLSVRRSSGAAYRWNTGSTLGDTDGAGHIDVNCACQWIVAKRRRCRHSEREFFAGIDESGFQQISHRDCVQTGVVVGKDDRLAELDLDDRGVET